MNVGCSFKNSSRGAKFRFKDERSPGGGSGGAGLTGVSGDVEPPPELPIDPPEAHIPDRVWGDRRLVEDVPRVMPAFPKLLKDRSCGRGEGVGAALWLWRLSAVGVLAVGLAITESQNSGNKHQQKAE